jgi:hypothetical protein
MIPSDKMGEVLRLISSDFGTENSISLIVVSLCLHCKRETQAGYMDSSSVFWGPAQPAKLAINSDPYFRTGNYFNSGQALC